MRMIYVLTGAVAVAGALALFGAGSSSSPNIAPEPANAAPKPVNAAPMNAAPAPPTDDDQAPGSAMTALEGEALETLTVPGYTYIRIGQKGAEGEWVAVASAPVNVGDHVRFQGQTVMTDFTSSTLKRTFPTIRFGALAGAGSAQPAESPHGASGTPAMPEGHPATTTPTTGEVKVGEVAKADGPNGLRIEELFSKKQSFAGKAARVRGVVVKATNGVMGKNFVHLRDGSGSDAQKNNDLTVTTSESVEKGQTVVLEGTVTLDKDLGAGYRYDVLLEDAKSVK